MTAAGLASKDIVPALASYFFDGATVTTHDDIVTMVAPFTSLPDFRGGVHGQTLLSWTKNQKAESIKWSVEGGTVALSSGRSHIKVPLVPEEHFIRKAPKVVDPFEPKDQDFWIAFKQAARSSGFDTAHDWRLGVTVWFRKDGVSFLSSDNLTCVASEGCKDIVHGHVGKSYILPPRFVELVTSDKASPVRWMFSDGEVGVGYTDGRWVFSRTLGAGSPVKHLKPFNSFDWDKLYPVPEGLADAVRTATVVLSNKMESVVKLTLLDGVLTVSAKTDLGAADESVEFAQSEIQEVSVSPATLLKALEDAKFMKITDGAVMFSGVSDMLVCVIS